MKSIGSILKAQREKKRLTLDDVHKFIRINPRYLNAMEVDDYSIFSDKVHAKGFLKIYTDFLELDVEQILALWRREYEAGFEKKAEEKRKFNWFNYKEKVGLRLTPRILFSGFLGLLIFVFFGYLFFQYKNYLHLPED